MSRWERSLGLCALFFFIMAGASFGAREEQSRAANSTAAPELPRILSARVVLGTKFGTAVRVSYCYNTLPSDPSLRPGRLLLTVDNLQDGLPPLGLGWPVTTRCNTVIHPVGGIQQPYVLRYTTESRAGTRSRQGVLRLRQLPDLARRPELPTTLVARIVTGTKYGKALRISYCFRSLPRDASRRPALLAVTLMNANDRLQARGYNSSVTMRCDTVTYPLAGIPPPYVLSYVVRSKQGTYSKRGEVRVH
ncbi:MAG TPA: hypothetical protein VFR38_04575 [Gaiellaceae bacterium]|nr:hypothetical protein [Gaiellaceae bacterium]